MFGLNKENTYRKKRRFSRGKCLVYNLQYGYVYFQVLFALLSVAAAKPTPGYLSGWDAPSVSIIQLTKHYKIYFLRSYFIVEKNLQNSIFIL